MGFMAFRGRTRGYQRAIVIRTGLGVLFSTSVYGPYRVIFATSSDRCIQPHFWDESIWVLKAFYSMLSSFRGLRFGALG